MTKKILLILAVIFASFYLQAQKCTKPFLGSKTLYKSQQQKYTRAPKGYQPVFINHVGRRGARHLTKDVATTLAYSLLLKAEIENGLSENGKLLKEKVWRLEKVEKTDFESISFEGQQEQWLLAERMYANYTPVFKQANPALNVAVTKKIRTTQTSEAFLTRLKTKINPPEIIRQINDTTLRFYDLAPAFKEYETNGTWIKLMEKIKEDYKYNALTKQFTERFFTPSFYKDFNEKDYANFTSNIFGFATIVYSIKKEIRDNGFKESDVDMSPFFTCDELKILGKIDDAEDFLLKGPGTNATGIQVKIAIPLLADFINTTDDFIKTKSVNLQLRFTHAEAIAPYAALMDITGASNPVNKIETFNTVWSAANVMPLSANIQWILYKKSGSNNYLVKFLLNEKEVAINRLPTKTFPYYNWKDVKTFYENKIGQLGSDLNENGFKYLKRIN